VSVALSAAKAAELKTGTTRDKSIVVGRLVSVVVTLEIY
jgi:hypothetical protein